MIEIIWNEIKCLHTSRSCLAECANPHASPRGQKPCSMNTVHMLVLYLILPSLPCIMTFGVPMGVDPPWGPEGYPPWPLSSLGECANLHIMPLMQLPSFIMLWHMEVLNMGFMPPGEPPWEPAGIIGWLPADLISMGP